jgi:hypothetical protein
MGFQTGQVPAPAQAPIYDPTRGHAFGSSGRAAGEGCGGGLRGRAAEGPSGSLIECGRGTSGAWDLAVARVRVRACARVRVRRLDERSTKVWRARAPPLD